MKALALVLAAAMLLLPGIAMADRGMAIIDPPYVHFTESGQRAIIAWNGTDEALLLSTDVSSSEPAKILEVLAVPNNVTEVREGSVESFTTLERLIWSKLPRPRQGIGLADEKATAPSIEIQFHEQIGPHEVMVVKVNDADYFKYWTRGFAFTRGFTYSEISLGFVNAVQDYIDRGINYFIFDVISTNATMQSVSPLLYRFKSDSLYYPMKITSASNISDYQSSLKLYLLTDQGVADQSALRSVGLTPGNGFSSSIRLSSWEVSSVNESFASTLPDGAYAMDATYYGSFRGLTEDLALGAGAFTRDSPSLPPYASSYGPKGPNYALGILIIAALVLFLVIIRPRG